MFQLVVDLGIGLGEISGLSLDDIDLNTGRGRRYPAEGSDISKRSGKHLVPAGLTDLEHTRDFAGRRVTKVLEQRAFELRAGSSSG